MIVVASKIRIFAEKHAFKQKIEYFNSRIH